MFYCGVGRTRLPSILDLDSLEATIRFHLFNQRTILQALQVHLYFLILIVKGEGDVHFLNLKIWATLCGDVVWWCVVVMWCGGLLVHDLAQISYT